MLSIDKTSSDVCGRWPSIKQDRAEGCIQLRRKPRSGGITWRQRRNLIILLLDPNESSGPPEHGLAHDSFTTLSSWYVKHHGRLTMLESTVNSEIALSFELNDIVLLKISDIAVGYDLCTEFSVRIEKVL